ncbi:MAG: hypothetical protein HYR55_17795 [Acidobacteria bacterium]|nr:hypothetical protein [Acidobacteriota bacterium]MBI3657584.1 hypothetical protein [Acidobacteriota bacterium]
MNRIKETKLTLVMTVVLLLGSSIDLWAIETVRVRPRRISIQQGDGAALLVIARAFPPAPDRYLGDLDVTELPPGVTPTFVPDALGFPDRGYLFLDVDPKAPVGNYHIRVIGDVYEGENIIRSIRSSTIMLEIQGPISPNKPGSRKGRRR